MFTTLAKLFARKTPSAPRPAARRLEVEALGERIVPAGWFSVPGTGVTTFLSGSTLNVYGSSAKDQIQFQYGATGARLSVSEQIGSLYSANVGSVTVPGTAGALTRVQFLAGSGQASFDNQSGLDSTLVGSSSRDSFSQATGVLSVSRTSMAFTAADHVSVSTFSNGQWLYEGEGGIWFRPGGAITSVSHNGATLGIHAADTTYLIGQFALGDNVQTTASTPGDYGMKRTFVQDYTSQDGEITRSGMIHLVNQAASDGLVTLQELQDLHTVVFAQDIWMPDDVRNLAQKLVTGYQPSVASSLFGSGAYLTGLEGKYFYGTDHPEASASYQYVSGPLFGSNGPRVSDIKQGVAGDCYFLASLAEVAYRNPQAIKDMFHDNGDGTWTVRFYDNGVAQYVTVDRDLPVESESSGWSSSSSQFVYARAGSTPSAGDGPLWVALAEKAYAQINQEGWLMRGNGYDGQDSYDGIGTATYGGCPATALEQITGHTGGAQQASPSGSSVRGSWVSGSYVVLSSGDFGTLVNGDGVVETHAYAYLGYNPQSHLHTLYNPWGVSSSGAAVILNLTDAQLAADFAASNTVRVQSAPAAPEKAATDDLLLPPSGTPARSPQPGATVQEKVSISAAALPPGDVLWGLLAQGHHQEAPAQLPAHALREDAIEAVFAGLGEDAAWRLA